MSEFVEWGALANVLIVGVLVGAGLPALFAVGVRFLAGSGSHDEGGQTKVSHVVLAWTCFAICVLAIAGAIWFLASGGH